ncbi:hypothetical protein ACIF8T_37735 [Streptomyces sp. NPDC085946]|uniref:hypothetical protein n=1 Tax=Streptomyces sp. NPDC085946 TaxID=3365744 RepID=UPI0037D59091
MKRISPEGFIAALEDVAASYAPGELAYLALTSKPELTVRDRLAWALQTRLAGAVVAREWRNTVGWIDLAVLDTAGDSPRALLELKAAYTFDFAGPDRPSAINYRNKIIADAEKLRSTDTVSHDTQLYVLLLLTHPMGIPSGGTAIKYRPGLSAALRAYGPEPLRHMAEHSVRALLSCLSRMHQGTLEGGAAFGVRVAIDYWLIGPLATGCPGTGA